MATSMFDSCMKAFRNKFPAFKDYKDYHLFTLMCIYFYFYCNTDASFDQDEVKSYLSDGANDGGIDAVFKEPDSDTDNLIIVQSKLYEKTKLTSEDIRTELCKIKDTLEIIHAHKFANLSAQMVSAYQNAVYEMDSGSATSTSIYFFTSYSPKNNTERNKLEKLAEKIVAPYQVNVCFGEDIANQINACESGNTCVEYDELDIDKPGNFLRYINPDSQNESVVVNISAMSLQNLYQRRGNNLLGMNLRYYVRQKAVDEGINKTIKEEPDSFWYRNNGIVIICDAFTLDGIKLKLKNFSIINGGQTTNRLGKADIGKDFYITCKVILAEGTTQPEKDKFALDIAASSNSQKPIRKADLMANTPEQIRLKERLSKCGVFYVTKKGEKPKSKDYQPYEIAKLDQVGKLSLAAVLQMPGSARSSSTKMYNEENYYDIFGDKAKASVIKDILRISSYYETFKKRKDLVAEGFDTNTVIPMIKNGKTFQIACIAFLCKIVYGVFAYEDIQSNLNDTDTLKCELKQMGNMDKLISAKLDDEEAIMRRIFSILSEEVLGYCFESVKDSEKEITPANFLKVDDYYYKKVIKRLWSRFKQNKELEKAIYRLCGKEMPAE